MGRLDWHKRDHKAALTGFANLTLEERGAYQTVLDLIYDHDGKVDDDERYLAGWMRCDVRVWKRIRARLIELGKLYVDGDVLRNTRADEEVTKGLSRIASAQEAGRASGRKRKVDTSYDNDLGQTSVERKLEPITVTKDNEKERNSPSESRSDDDLFGGSKAEKPSWPVGYFATFWSAYPLRVAKQDAVKALERVKRKGLVSFNTVYVGAVRYAESCKAKDRQFIKHPATWINGGCWDDEIPTSGANNGKSSGTHREPGLSRSDEITAGVDRVRDRLGVPRRQPEGPGRPVSPMRDVTPGAYANGGGANGHHAAPSNVTALRRADGGVGPVIEGTVARPDRATVPVAAVAGRGREGH